MGQNLFLMSHPGVSLVNILLSITRVSLVQNKCVFCQLRVHFSPVFFLLYINDITNQFQSNVRLFADDSIVYREIRSPEDHQILQTDIQMLTDWSKKWQMNFNTSKCHLLTITHKPKPSEFTYTISNQPISRVNSQPYLGVTIDAKLSCKHMTRHSIQICQDTWSTQTNPISRKTESKGGSLYYASKTEIRIWINSLEPTYPE